jgi:hypothetical protein
METQNITLSLPKTLLRQARLIAVQRQTSVSGLLAQTLAEIVAQEDGYAAARRRHLAHIVDATDLGTRGTPGWGRDELHER